MLVLKKFKLCYVHKKLSKKLKVYAVGGIRVMLVRINTNPECFDIWGEKKTPD